MAESSLHRDLVQLAINILKANIPESEHWLIKADTDGFVRPRSVVNDFVPDVLFESDTLLIIGEAKTYDDFERKHSIEQYESYFEEFRICNKQSIFIISIPWGLFVTAKNYFRYLRRTTNTNVVVFVVNELSECEQV